MPVIKRYSNRKLYDTETKRYITLQEITRLIQGGKEIQVVDNDSGEDLTNLTLTQIILEQEKRSASGVVPRFLLTSIIRAGEDRLSQMRRTLRAAGESAGVEAGSLKEQTDAAIEQGQQMVDQVQALLRIDERIADVLHLLNLPSTRDMKQMQARLDELAAKMDERENTEPASSQSSSSRDGSASKDAETSTQPETSP
jgi:polyhydroxyalkanoate synthesis repressor PhaR